jgi:DNA repair protein RecN (Recombination protein N)
MLSYLEVKNFALIDDLSIKFNNGLTALTGETGSGKSILLESLQLLFGKRSDAEYIRTGTTKAIVVGKFVLTKDQSKVLDLPEEITLSREIDQSGRHYVKLNDEVITLSRLKTITNKIGLIHGQNDTYQLLDKSSYVQCIDQLDLGEVTNLLQSYLLKRSSYQDAAKALDNLKSKKQETLERADFLKFQINELKSYRLVKGEKQDLEEKVQKLKNFDSIQQALKLSYETFNGQFFQTDLLYDAYKQMSKISQYDASFSNISKLLEESFYNLEEAKKSVETALEYLDFDSEAFNNYQERLYELSKIEMKYAKSNDDLVIYLDQMIDELAMSEDFDGYLKNAKEKLNILYNETYKLGESLSNYRKKVALKLEKSLTESLHELDLEKAQFKIQFEPLTPNMSLGEDGLDTVEFMISLNEGEPLKPLSKVASGGEKARFMFALKSLFALNSALSLLVFDEIDIGISGKTATKMANVMRRHSKSLQILVITHLAQVAAKADHHYSIYKSMVDKRMQTHIHMLTMDERILSIAGMLSDDEITPFAIEQAKMLLK